MMQRYNRLYKVQDTENILEVWFVQHTQRYSKDSVSLRGNAPDPLWRDGADSQFLQEDQTQKTSSRQSLPILFPPSTKVSRFRIDPGVALRDHHGHEAHQQDRVEFMKRLKVYLEKR